LVDAPNERFIPKAFPNSISRRGFRPMLRERSSARHARCPVCRSATSPCQCRTGISKSRESGLDVTQSSILMALLLLAFVIIVVPIAGCGHTQAEAPSDQKNKTFIIAV